MIRQPVQDILSRSRSVLIAGAGGGYDVFGGLPLFFELLEMGVRVHLASLSFAYLNGLDGAVQDPEIPNLYAVSSAAATERAYCPEAWLSAWLEERHGHREPIWCFDKTGVRPLHAAYRHLVEALDLDAIVLVDGGVDALLRGDESSIGTPEEDLASLAAVRALDVPVKLLACVGLGAEIRDGICHSQVFERIAELARQQGYLGSVALVPGIPSCDLLLEAAAHVFERQAEQRQSHVQRLLHGSMRGEFGARGPHVWLSPLLGLCWFFSLDAVARTHLFLPELAGTETIWDVSAIVRASRKQLPIRERQAIPI